MGEGAPLTPVPVGGFVEHQHGVVHLKHRLPWKTHQTIEAASPVQEQDSGNPSLSLQPSAAFPCIPTLGATQGITVQHQHPLHAAAT